MKATVLALALMSIACGPSVADRPASTPSSEPVPPLKGVTIGPPHQPVQRMSMVVVLGDPSLLDGKAIAVVGYLDLAFESDHFCLHKEDAENLLITNCVSISVPHTPEVMALNRRYVALQGVIHVGPSGHLGKLFDRAIQDVRSIDPMLSKDEMRNRGKAQ